MAWPVDLADGAVLTAAHLNSVKNSVATWGGHVNAAGYNLGAVADVSAKSISMINADLDSAITMGDGTGSLQYVQFKWNRAGAGYTVYYAGIGQVMLLRSDGIFIGALVGTTQGPAGSGLIYKDGGGFLKIS